MGEGGKKARPLVLVVFGALLYFVVTEGFRPMALLAAFLISVGVLIVATALYGVIIRKETCGDEPASN